MRIRISYEVDLLDRWVVALQHDMDKPADHSTMKTYLELEGTGGLEELHMCWGDEAEKKVRALTSR